MEQSEQDLEREIQDARTARLKQQMEEYFRQRETNLAKLAAHKRETSDKPEQQGDPPE